MHEVRDADCTLQRAFLSVSVTPDIEIESTHNIQKKGENASSM